jgi:ribosomal protein S18 acetylase RimI-like enzyme
MIKPASITDLDAVLELEKQFGAEAFSKRSLRHFINTGALRVFIDNEANIIGSAILLERKNSNKVRLYSFIIDERFRGKGVGRSYLHALMFSNPSWREMCLEVSVNNTPAIRLYKSLGFQEQKRLNEFYSDGSDAIKLKYILSF